MKKKNRQPKKKILTKEERAKEKRKEAFKNYLIIAICSIFCIGIALAYFKVRAFLADEINSCGDPKTLEQDIMSAENINLTGSFKNLNMHGRMECNGKGIGTLVEEGTLNPVVHIKGGDTEVFTIEKSKKMTKKLGNTVYAFKTAEGKIDGYVVENIKESYFPVLDKEGQEAGFYVEPKGACIIDKNEHVVAQTKDGSVRVDNTNFKVESSFKSSDVLASARCYMLYKRYREASSDYSSGLEE